MKFKFKMHLIATVLLGGLLSFTLTSQAATYNYTTLDHPNATGFTYAKGINDSGQVTGTFQDATGSHGFLYDPIVNTYSTLDHPDANAGSTVAFGINENGQVIGTFYNGTGGINSNPHFFVFDGNAYTTLDFAGNGVPSENFATGINNSGQVTGYFQDGWGHHGFVYDGSAFNTLDHPDGLGGNTYAYDINNSGQVTGTFYNGTGNHGFVYNGGTYITLNAPDAQTDMSGYGGTHTTGINDSGLVTGYFYSNFNGHGPSNHGYVYDGTTYSIIDVPGVSSNYLDEGTIAFGINNRGQVAGTFQNTTGYHGFVATPSAVPIPGAIWLFGSAITGMIGFVRRKPIKQVQRSVLLNRTCWVACDSPKWRKSEDPLLHRSIVIDALR